MSEVTSEKKTPATAKVSKKNPTTNYPMDPHKAFCRRCIVHHWYECPVTHRNPTPRCKL